MYFFAKKRECPTVVRFSGEKQPKGNKDKDITHNRHSKNRKKRDEKIKKCREKIKK